MIVLDRIPLVGAGSSTVIAATNPSQGAIELTGTGSLGAALSNCTVQYATFGSQPPSPGSASLQKSAIWINIAAGFTVNGVTVVNSPGDGIDVIQSSGIIENTAIKSYSDSVGSQAYGIYISECTNLQVLNNSVVSRSEITPPLSTDYHAASTGLTINGNRFQGPPALAYQEAALVVDLNGVQQSVFDNNSLTSCVLQVNASYVPVSGVEIKGNSIRNASGWTCAGIYINGPQPVSNIQITDNTIQNILLPPPTNNGFAIYTYGTSSETISGNTINGASIGIWTQYAIDTSILNNTITNTQWSAMFGYCMGGTTQVSGNHMTNYCLSTQTGPTWTQDDVMAFTPYLTSTTPQGALTVTNNSDNTTQGGRANNAQYFISVPEQALQPFPTLNISGNQSLLPNQIP